MAVETQNFVTKIQTTVFFVIRKSKLPGVNCVCKNMCTSVRPICVQKDHLEDKKKPLRWWLDKKKIILCNAATHLPRADKGPNKENQGAQERSKVTQISSQVSRRVREWRMWGCITLVSFLRWISHFSDKFPQNMAVSRLNQPSRDGSNGIL